MNNPGRPLPIPGFIGWLFSEPRQVTVPVSPTLPRESTYVCATCGRQVTKGVRQCCLDQPQRFVWNKLISGAFRVGVSLQLVTRAIGQFGKVDQGGDIFGKSSPPLTRGSGQLRS